MDRQQKLHCSAAAGLCNNLELQQSGTQYLNLVQTSIKAIYVWLWQSATFLFNCVHYQYT